MLDDLDAVSRETWHISKQGPAYVWDNVFLLCR